MVFWRKIIRERDSLTTAVKNIASRASLKVSDSVQRNINHGLSS